MRYQKSMMKILESLFSRGGEWSVDSLIKASRTGRNSSFEALDFLESIGFVRVEKNGNQKRVVLSQNNYTFQFKYYFDSIELKNMDKLVQLVLNLFNLEISKFSKFKFGILFGSVLDKKTFNDIDILLVGKNLKISDLRVLDKIKKELERFFGVILNLHIGNSNFENILKGVVFYQSSFIFDLDEIQKQYLEFFESFCEGIFGDDKLFDVSLINLAYVFCKLNRLYPKTKKNAIDYFRNQYKVKNFRELNIAGIEIGKKVFN